MIKSIRLMIGQEDIDIELNDSNTANAIWLAVPFTSTTNVWGKEIYFEIPVKDSLENGKKILEVGEVAYWPDGKALCLFFGPTPASKGNMPEAITPVTPVGKIVGDPRRLERIGDRMKVTASSI